MKYIDYIIVLSSLLISASPFFLEISVYVPFTFMLIIFIYALFRRDLKNNKRIFQVLIAVYALILIQSVLYGGFTPSGIYKPLLIFFTPYIFYRLYGLNYFRYIFNIIYYSSIFTFPIYLMQSLFQHVNDLVLGVMEFAFPYAWTDWPRTILFYSMPRESGLLLLRNSGIFHEPGAFSLYLMLAIIINTFNTRNMLDKKNIILAIILLSTFSTAGYVVLTLFMAYALPKSKLHFILKYSLLVFMVFITITAYRNADFLQQKIEDQYSDQAAASKFRLAYGGRFFAYLIAYEDLKQNIFFGRGILNVNSLDRTQMDNSLFDWGFMGFLAKYGTIFGLFYLFYYYRGLDKLCLFYGLPKGLAIISFIVIHLGLSTQAFFFHTSFIMFFIIGIESDANIDTPIML